LFIADANVVANGILALRILSFGFLFYAIGMVLMQGFNGSGDTITPTKINLLSFWMVEIPLAYLLAVVLNMGLEGASIAIICAESVLAATALILFRKGKWKLRKI
jgi:Na+-driven multidrug efflux pump